MSGLLGPAGFFGSVHTPAQVYVQGGLGSGTAGANATVTNYDTSSLDNTSSFNTTTGIFTAPVGGDYLFIFYGYGTGGTAANTEWQLRPRVNGANENWFSRNYHSTYAHAGGGLSFGIRTLAAGDTLAVYQVNDVGDNISITILRLNDIFTSYFSGYKTTATGSAGSAISGFTEMVDAGGNFDAASGVFTVPTTGKYLIGWKGFPSSGTTVADHVRIAVNGTDMTSIANYSDVHNAWGDTKGRLVILDLTAGNTVTVKQTTKIAEHAGFIGIELPSSCAAFRAYKGSGTMTAASPLVLDTEAFDEASAFNTGTGLFTAPSDGLYFFSGGILAYKSTSAVETVAINKNGSAVNKQALALISGGGDYTEALNPAMLLQLTAGDTIGLAHNTGTTSIAPQLSGFKVI